MRFGRVHRVMTDALAALGLLSLLSSGGLERWMVISLAVGLAVAILLPERWQSLAQRARVGMVGSILLLAVEALRLFWGTDFLQVAVEFAAALQILRIATRRGAAHDQQIVLLSLLHLIAGTVLGGGMAYGLCFLGFLVVAPGALVLSHLRREVEGNYRQGARDRSGLPVDVPRILRSRRVVSRNFLAVTCSLAVPIFVFTAVLFVFFPRVGLSLLLMNQGRGERMVGFSDQVDLGKVGALRTDSTIALRVVLPNLPPEPPQRIPLYLRGAAFDSYDGTTWRRDRTQMAAEVTGDRVWIDLATTRVGAELMTVDLEPIRPPVLFLPTGAAVLDLIDSADKTGTGKPRITRGREGDFEYLRNDERGVRYRVYAAAERGPAPALSPLERARYTSLPPGLPPRLSELARRWAADAEQPLEIARRVEAHLRTEYTYDLASPSGAAANPLDHFLFESRRGHCEFYSTAMAILLRTLGVPARNVTGFMGATFNRFGRFYAVRQGEAHSWVEVHGSDGWVRFDPTPSGAATPVARVDGLVATLRDFLEAAGERWDRHVVGYDLDQQLHLFNRLRGALRSEPATARELQSVLVPAAAVLAVLGAGAALLYYWRRRRRGVDRPPTPEEVNAAQRRIVALYQQLEDVFRLWGTPRNPSLPPLLHARALLALKHPQAQEVLELTEWYLSVRFGRADLGEREALEFERRVARLRQRRVPEAA